MSARFKNKNIQLKCCKVIKTQKNLEKNPKILITQIKRPFVTTKKTIIKGVLTNQILFVAQEVHFHSI